MLFSVCVLVVQLVEDCASDTKIMGTITGKAHTEKNQVWTECNIDKTKSLPIVH